MANAEKRERTAAEKHYAAEAINSPYISLVGKMKQSVYNSLCWQTAGSHMDTVSKSRSSVARSHPLQNLTNKETIYNVMRKCGDSVVKKCGDYLKENRAQREKSKIGGNSRDSTHGSGSYNRKRFSHHSPDPSSNGRNESVESMDAHRKYEDQCGTRKIPELRDADVINRSRNPTRDCKQMDVVAEGNEQMSRLNDKYGNEEGEKRNHNTECKQLVNMQDLKRNTTMNKRVQERSEVKRCKQIYELTEDQCRNFKEKGYVKVNVKVKPNVSVSDFDIIIRRDKIKHPVSKH